MKAGHFITYAYSVTTHCTICGTPKVRTGNNQNLACNGCGRSPYCGMMFCPLEGYNNRRGRRVHSHNLYDLTITCVCGTAKLPPTNIGNIQQCTSPACYLHLCTFANCYFSSLNIQITRTHYATIHRIRIPEANRNNECSCGQPKPARIPGTTWDRCPKCEQDWCLVLGCEYVATARNVVLNHQRTIHNM